LVLLGAMMVININLALSGFFELVTARVMQLARTPRVLLALIIVAAGVLSAIFLNDTIFVMVTPLVVDLTLRLKRNPIPYLIGLATATNVVSNVPAVLLLRPVVASMSNRQLGWLTLAMASTLAGNLTLLGSAANLIVAELASKRDVDLDFMTYL